MYDEIIDHAISIHRIYGVPACDAVAEAMETVRLDPVTRPDIYEVLLDQAEGRFDF